MRHLLKSLSIAALITVGGAGMASAQDFGPDTRIERGDRADRAERRERREERREARERDGTGSLDRGGRSDRGDRADRGDRSDRGERFDREERRDRADRDGRFDRRDRRDSVVIREDRRERFRPGVVIRDRFVAPLVVRPRVRTVCRIEIRERFNTANGVLRRQPVQVCREVASRRVVSTRVIVR